MKNNNGFTLIELIVVILIVSLLGMGTITGIGMLSNGNTKKTAQMIINALDLVQMENMTKKSVYLMTITQNGEGVYYLNVLCDGAILSSEKLKLKNGTISYQTADSEAITVNTSNKLEIVFRKDTGGIKLNSSNQIITRISVTGGGNTIDIRLATATGKHFIE